MHLHDLGASLENVALVAKGSPGAGNAYDCDSANYRLNVRAELMRLWPDRPNHFAEWATRNLRDDTDAKVKAGSFYRRRDFARYVESELSARGIMKAVTMHEGEAAGISRHPDGRGWRVNMNDDTHMDAGAIVCATGNPAPVWPVTVARETVPGLVRNPWPGDWERTVARDANVVVMGSGLTAMDVIHALDAGGHVGRITMISPSGLHPPAQCDWHETAPAIWPDAPTASVFLRFMRRRLGGADWNDPRWQAAFESLRVNISPAWRSLSHRDKSRLARRAGWLWRLARFRAAPQTIASLDALLASGRLSIVRDRVRAIRGDPHGANTATLARAGEIKCDVIINCSGAARDGFMQGLVRDGVAKAAPGRDGHPALGPGLCLVAPDGRCHDTLFAVGPPTAWHEGDIIGASSVSRQAMDMATRLVGTLAL